MSRAAKNGQPEDTLFKLSGRTSPVERTVVKTRGAEIGGGRPVVFAGPCSVESRNQIIEIAGLAREAGAKVIRGGAFKPRTSPYSFQGLGEEGLSYLAEAGKETGLPVVTEVIDAADVTLVGQYADILQVGSRNMHNYRLLREVGRQEKPVLLKRGMSATFEEFLLSAEYIMSEGNPHIILCERGIRTFSDFTRNTLDLSIVPAIKSLSHLPIIVDPSHGTGRRDLVAPMSMAALAAGAHGIMVEIHTRPEASISDAEQTISTDQFSNLMKKIDHFLEWQEAYANASHAY